MQQLPRVGKLNYCTILPIATALKCSNYTFNNVTSPGRQPAHLETIVTVIFVVKSCSSFEVAQREE